MKLPSFFKVPKYKSFNISPRYYDPVKEEQKKREERIRAELRQEQGEALPNQSEVNIRSFYQNRKSRSRVYGQHNSGLRVLIILAALVVLMYLIFIR